MRHAGEDSLARDMEMPRRDQADIGLCQQGEEARSRLGLDRPVAAGALQRIVDAEA